MSTAQPRAKSKRVEHDLHELVGQVVNERLRVVRLSYVSPRQWLYEVEPPSVGKTRRALKVLGHPSGREPGSFYRLKTALDKLKSLSSPHLERVYECGVLYDLTPYVLTEWEPHSSLYEQLRLRKAPLSWVEAQPVLMDICRGLQALHAKGVTHGDLRAQHVLLRAPLHDACLIDFAVSGAFGAPPAPGLERSFAYWAPERLTFASATPSTDLYSFGVLAYLCLEGCLPFRPLPISSEQPVDPQMSLTQQHLSVAPAPFTQPIPEPIKRLIMKLLSKDPYLRPSSAELVLSCLSHPQEDIPPQETSRNLEQATLTREPQERSEHVEKVKKPHPLSQANIESKVELESESESIHGNHKVVEHVDCVDFESPQKTQQQQRQRLTLIALCLLSAPLAVFVGQWL